MKYRRAIASIAVTVALLAAVPQTVMAEWEKAGGPEGCEITALCGTGSTFFAGTNSFGIFRSIDSGQSWAPVNTGFPTANVHSLAAYENYIFVGTYAPDTSSINNNFLISTDNGATWTAANEGLPAYQYVSSIAVNGTNIYAGMQYDGVYLSSDAGKNWSAVNSGLPLSPSFNVFSLAAIGNNIFAGTNDGVYISSDTGKTWTQVNSGFSNLHVNSLVVSDSTIFAGTVQYGVLLSSDTGKSWSKVNEGLPLPPQYQKVNSLAIDDGNIFALMRYTVFISTNNGAHWDTITTNFPQPLTSLAASGNSVVIGTRYSGIFRSTNDEKSSNAVNSGLPMNLAVTSLETNGNNLFSATYHNGIFLSRDAGTSWKPINSDLMEVLGAAFRIYSFAVTGGNLLAGTDKGIFVSADTGANWTRVDSNIINYRIESLAVNGNKTFGGIYDRLYQSTNNGTSWNQVSSDSIRLTFYSVFPCGNTIFAMCDRVYVNSVNPFPHLYLSTDNGVTWNQGNYSSGLPYTVTSLVPIGSNIVAGTNGAGAFLSTDNGTSWSAIDSAYLPDSVYCLTTKGGNLFAGTNKGVYLSTDNGIGWTAVNTGLTDPVWHLTTGDNYLFAGTPGSTVWRRQLSEFAETGVICNPEHTLSHRKPSVILSSGRTGTTSFITFSTPRRERVTLTLYDLAGHALRTIANGQYGPGQQTLYWNNGALVPGCYMIKMRMGTNTYVKNVMLVK